MQVIRHKILLLVCSIALVTPLAYAQCFPKPSGLIGWWQGEGNALDSAGTNNGTFRFGSAVSGTGEVGQGFIFNGQGADIIVPNNPQWAFGTNDFSIELWANTTTLGENQATLAYDSGGGNLNKWILWLNSNNLQLHINSPGGGATYVTSTTFSRTTNQWYHLAITRRGTVFTFYKNGAVVSTTTSSVSIPAASVPMTFGSAEGSFFFHGQLDEISIYNRAITNSEVASIYAAGSAGKCKSPWIKIPPQSQIGIVGRNAGFSVSAGGSPTLGYQWIKDGQTVSNAFASSLFLTNIQFSDTAGYSVIITNLYGSVTSTPPATLSVNPFVSSIALYPGVTIDGIVSNTYGIQASTNLADINSWIGLTNLMLIVPTEIWYDSIPASLGKQFYRVLPGPISIP